MKINIKNSRLTFPLNTREFGDVFTRPDTPDTFYIVIRPDYELDDYAGIYCVDLKNGELFCFSGDREIIPVSFEGTATY